MHHCSTSLKDQENATKDEDYECCEEWLLGTKLQPTPSHTGIDEQDVKCCRTAGSFSPSQGNQRYQSLDLFI